MSKNILSEKGRPLLISNNYKFSKAHVLKDNKMVESLHNLNYIPEQNFAHQVIKKRAEKKVADPLAEKPFF